MRLLLGDCVKIMASLDEGSVAAVSAILLPTSLLIQHSTWLVKSDGDGNTGSTTPAGVPRGRPLVKWEPRWN